MAQTAIKAPKGHEALYERLELTTPLPSDGELERWSERALRAELGRHVAAARAVLQAGETERRSPSADEETELRRLNAEMDRIERALAAQGGVPEVRRLRLEVPDPNARHEEPVGSGSRWLDLKTGREVRALRPQERLADTVAVAPEHRGARVGRFLRGLITGNWTGADVEQRMLTITVGTAGGVLVPAPLSAQLIDLARAQTRVIQAGAQTLGMTSASLDLARVVGDPAAAWYQDEVRTAGFTETQGTFGRLTLTAKTLAILTRASIELAMDAPNFEQVIENQIAAALAVEIDRAVLFGIMDGQWQGLRTWYSLAGVPDVPNSLNEISMGTNGAQLTDWAKLVTAIQNVYEGNFPGTPEQLALIMAPRTWGALEGLKEATTNAPLRAPASVQALKKFITSQCPVTETQGSSNIASTAFIGDFSQVVLSIRLDPTIEATREGGDSFTRGHVLVRGLYRGDWSVLHPKFLTRIIGIIP